MEANRVTLGVCYYPEHWPEPWWEDDLRLMRAHGIETVRIGEFAWGLLEPREGEYDFALFDRFLALCTFYEMRVIFGTPTAAPPRWLTERHPEVCNADVTGVPYHPGLRRHYNYNAEAYLAHTERIVRALGERYGNHPQIVGWQIDNELNCETADFHAEADHAAFRAYMKEKYGTLEALNACMGTVVWSQQFSDWEQVALRRPTIGGQYNPHLLLEESRFVSRSAVRYCRLQCDVLRPLIGDRWITTNGIFARLDYRQLVPGALDFLCFDSYPNFHQDLSRDPANDDDMRDRYAGMPLTATRALSPRFGIMEQQSGANGWTGRMEAPMPRPGQMRLWTLQSIAHGADFVSYFRWRTAPVGTEIYWHGILDADNNPNRRLEELARIRRDVERIEDIAGARYAADVAIVRDFPNEWDAELDAWHGRLHACSLDGWFRACQHAHAPMDYLYLDERTTLEDLHRYHLLVYPHAAILTEPVAHLLAEYARAGGTLVFGARTGYKDEYGRYNLLPLAGFAGELAGARVKDHTFVGPYDEPGAALWGDRRLDAPVYNDILEPTAPDAVVEAVYDANHYKGDAALISRARGRGRIYYFGAAFDEDAARAFLDRFNLAEPYRALLHLPPEVELAVRERDGRTLLFVLNYMRAPARIMLRRAMLERLSGARMEGEVDLPAFGALVLETEG